MKMKFVIGLLIATVVAVGGFYAVNYLSFTGMLDKTYSREDVVENFIKYENEFAQLELYFNSKTPKSKKKQEITFGLGKEKNQIILSLYPMEGVINNANPVIGGNDLELNSSKLDSVIIALGWTNETVDTLISKLSKTNCELIRTNINHNSIEIFYKRSGLGLFSYSIFNQPLSEGSMDVYGKPINTNSSRFVNRVVVKYNSAL